MSNELPFYSYGRMKEFYKDARCLQKSSKKVGKNNGLKVNYRKEDGR